MADLGKTQDRSASSQALETANPKNFKEFVAYDEWGEPVVLRSNISAAAAEPQRSASRGTTGGAGRERSPLGTLRFFFDFAKVKSIFGEGR